ncbi:MAG TPA: copper resistance protein NlpE N-terminal domain-containing protein [Acidobacteriaceae bacterium]
MRTRCLDGSIRIATPELLFRLLLLPGLCCGTLSLAGPAFGLTVRLVRIAALDASEQNNAAGTYHGQAPAADAAKRVFTLNLDPDGSATLTTVYVAKGRATEHGHWKQNGEEVVFTFDPIGSNPPQGPITFRYHHRALRPTQWDRSEWGQRGPPVLTRSRAPDGPADDSRGTEKLP